ncbi:MAG: O-antigen ligase family protein [Firmicutes bacterium]|nr:O-antigen ligase family protein [Bacillota bacterium]
MQIIKNSIVFKFIYALMTFFANAWNHSLLNRCVQGLGFSWEHSAAKRRWIFFYSRKDPAAYSLWAKLLEGIEAVFLWIGKLLQASLFYRLVCGLKDLYFKLTKNSLVFGWINRLSLKQWFYIAFACYLPLEYLLRDLLHLGIAGIWEELFILLGGVFVCWRSCFEEHKGVLSRASSVEAALVLYILVGMALMLLIRPYPAIALAGYRAQFEYLIWFMLILRLIDTKKDARFLIYAFLAVMTVLSLHGIYQFIIAVPIPASWTSQGESAVRTRVFSLTGSPNIFGALLILSAPIAAALMYYCKKTWQKIFFLAVTFLICLCDLFTFSKGSWIGLAAAVVLFAFLVDRRLLGLMAAGIGAILVAVPSITNRIAYVFTADYAMRSAAAGRTMRWKAGLDLLYRSNKWLGFGLGRFGGAVAMNNRVLEETNEFKYFTLDNYYMKTLVEMGWVGLLCFILLLAILLAAGFRATGRQLALGPKDPEKDPLFRHAGNDGILCAGVLCGLVAVIIHCYYENLFEEPYMMAYFWGIAAALICLGCFTDKREEA